VQLPSHIGTEREAEAWSAVVAMAEGIDPQRITTRDDAIALATQTIEVVAGRLHPEKSDAKWQFTVPEACAIAEQTAARLGAFVSTSIPLGDRLTIAQALALYRWRGAVSVAERAYDAWRLIRLANPATAVTHEMRDRLSRQMLDWSRDQVAGRLARALVLETGRSAIDLYSGRLVVSLERDRSRGQPSTPSSEPLLPPEAPRVVRSLIAGPDSSAIKALLHHRASFAQIEAEQARPATPPAVTETPVADRYADIVLVEGPGFPTGDAAAGRPLVNAVMRVADRTLECDMLVWMTQAVGKGADAGDDPGFGGERAAIDAVRSVFRDRPERRIPPIIIAVTADTTGNDASGRAGPVDADMAAQLAKRVADRLGVEESSVVVSSQPEPVMAAMVQHIDAARRAARLRHAAQERRKLKSWRRVAQQSATAGRLLGGFFGRSADADRGSKP
jgi:hypothetical protein